MRFKLVKTGKRYAEAEETASTLEDRISGENGEGSLPLIDGKKKSSGRVALSQRMEEEGLAPESLTEECGSTRKANRVYHQVMKWAGDDPKRWRRIHNAFLKIYAPTWERIDARDMLVAWAAAHLAITSAQRRLKDLENLERPLTSREHDSKRAREADMSFWGRLVATMDSKALKALSEDAEATRVIEKAIFQGTKRESARTYLEESSS